MPLVLVTGRVHASKTGRLHSRLLQAAREGRPAFLVLPSMPDVDRAVSELSAKVSGGVRVAAMDQFVEELWSLYGDGRRLVDSAGRVAALIRVIGARGERDPVTETRGFISVMEDIVSGVAGESSLHPHGPWSERVARISREYGLELRESGLIEPGEAMTLLSLDVPDLGGPVAFNRFTDLSAAQERLVVGMAGLNEVLIALPWEAECPATEALDGLVARLVVRGAHEHMATPEPTGELSLMERDVYRPREPHRVEGRIVMATAGGPEAEVALAAQMAAREVADGVEPDHIAVVFRDLADRSDALVGALRSVSLPIELDCTVPFGRTPYGAAMRALLDVCAGREQTRERLLTYLLSPYAGGEPGAAMERDAGWRAGRLTGSDLLADAVRTLPPRPAGALRLARRICSAPLDGSTLSRWIELGTMFLANAVRDGRHEGAAAALDAAAHAVFTRTVAEVADAGRGTALDLELSNVLEQAQVPRRWGSGGILVTEAHKIMSRRFDVVILGGMSASEFSSERPASLAAELLRGLGVEPGVDERLRERLLFYMVATRARHRFIMLRQVSSGTGEPVRPSVFWEEIEDLYRVEDEEAPAVPVEHLGMSAIDRAAPAFDPRRRESRHLGVSPTRPTRGQLDDPRVLERLAGREEFAVSELETYLSCPYRWFVERAVRPVELDAEFDSRELGSRAHESIGLFYSRWLEDTGLHRIPAERLDQALDLARAVTGEVAQRSRVGVRGLAEELAQARVDSWVQGIVSDDVEFLPGFEVEAHELEFGIAAGEPFEFGGARLRGRIDRIDRSRQGLVVTDYKSSADVQGYRSFESAGLLQVAVYAVVVSRVLGQPILGGVYRSLSTRSARGFALEPLDIGVHGNSRDSLTPESYEEMLERTGHRVDMAVRGIRAGDIARRPSRKDACAYCTLRVACKEAES